MLKIALNNVIHKENSTLIQTEKKNVAQVSAFHI